MSGFDLILEKEFSLTLLKDSLEKVLDSPPGQEWVEVFVDYPEKALNTSTQLMVVVFSAAGDVSQVLNLFFQGASSCNLSPVEFAKKLSLQLSCFCLVSDDDIDPYTMLKVGVGDKVGKVSLSAEELDKQGKYIIENCHQLN